MVAVVFVGGVLWLQKVCVRGSVLVVVGVAEHTEFQIQRALLVGLRCIGWRGGKRAHIYRSE